MLTALIIMGLIGSTIESVNASNDLRSVFSAPENYMGKKVVLCGLPWRGIKTKRSVYQRDPYGYPFAVEIGDDVRSERKEDGQVCYRGVWNRRDTSSQPIVDANGFKTVVSHEASNTAYYLAGEKGARR